MKTFTIILTSSIEAENEKKALRYFLKQTTEDMNTGENIEIEEEAERFCIKCGKTSGLLETEDMCFGCARLRGRI